MSGGFSLFSPIPPSLSRSEKKQSLIFWRLFYSFFCFSGWNVIKTRKNLIRLRHMKSYDGLLQSSFMFFMQLVVLFTRPSVGTLHGMPNGRCEQLTIFWTFSDTSRFFSLDPGDRADEQLVEPALGRHNLSHGLGRQAICLQAADQADALLPRPLCFQMPYNCHLLHLHEGIFV